MERHTCARVDRSSAGVRVVLIILMFAVPLLSNANIEGDSLHAWRKTWIDPARVLSGWDPNLADPCKWHRVTCNSRNSVIGVLLGDASLSGRHLRELSLTGDASTDLVNLPNLRYLDLHGNNFSGNIPPELGNLTQLISLDLSENHFSGEIPSSLGQLRNLQYLLLDQNELTGPIPGSLTTLPALLLANLSYNNLTGIAPRFPPSVTLDLKGNPYLIVD